MSSSVHAGGKVRDILILGDGPIQELNGITLTAEAKYPINFTQSGKIFVLGHCVVIIMEITVYYLLMLHNYISLKQKTLK